MMTAIVMGLIFILIILSVANGISVLYPLIAGLIIAFAGAVIKGYKPADIFKMIISGIKKSSIIYEVFVLIGAIISVWIASGTVPGLMYYGLGIINPRYFIIICFLLSTIVGMVLGTSFGTVSTIGIALMAVGRGFGINTGLIAGAIISGAYIGDRSSPMSSSAVLTAAVTDSEVYSNLKYMISTFMPAFIISLGLYFISENCAGRQFVDMSRVLNIQKSIADNFNISPIVLIPPVFVMVLPFFKINIKINMLAGIMSGALIAIILQGTAILELFRYMVSGYSKSMPDSFLTVILQGGGIVSMVKVSLIIAVSSGLNGIFERTGMLDGVLNIFNRKIKGTGSLVLMSAIAGVVTAAYGCSQTLSIMMTSQIIKPAFEKFKLSNSAAARTIADTCVVLSPLIPWNIAGLVPAVSLGVKVTDFIPYSYFCMVMPVITIIYAYAGHIEKNKDL